ncbi:MAG: RNA polymerase sporulation sigma factor SigH [Lachnospiraceae bacterium]|nr:RNA polymerase sporulation sigma factor SigH [Lachnospiraceae bacterium]MBR2401444.1 RNA polymerase sporulation sigma factor SigH [Lachnospiraceae bacterium]MBR3684279.1 RNA polymerase sporulation sigma factor SigH [Lachnospiraceae bacterium]
MVRDFSEYTDEELILLLREGETAVTDYIMEKYKNLVRSKAKSMFILGADKDDLIQEGMIGLFKAIRDYDSGRDASFFTFADLCVSRQMYTAVQSSNRKKHEPLNKYISLNASSEEIVEDSSGQEFMNILANSIDQSPEEIIIDRENIKLLSEKIEQELSTFEKQVYDLHLTGMAYTDIAKVLGKDEKSTDNALQRIKNKLRKIL